MPQGRPLDVALRVDPLGSALPREEAQVGSAVSQRLAAGRSREGGRSGSTNLPRRLARQLDGLRLEAGNGNHRTRARAPRCPRPVASATGRCERATTTTRHAETLKWQSPREHRALVRLQRRSNATDFTADQGPEVERTRKSGPVRRTPLAGSARRHGWKGGQRREGNGGGEPAPRSTHVPRDGTASTTRREHHTARDRKDRLTPHSFCEGESSEGCDANGKGQGKPSAFPGAAARPGGLFGARRANAVAAHQPGSSESRQDRVRTPARAAEGPVWKRTTDPEAGNLANPMIGFRAQQT